MNAQQIANILVQSSRARSLSIAQLAAQLGEPMGLVAMAMGEACTRATGKPYNVPLEPSLTFDRVIASHLGRASAAGAVDARGSMPLRTVFVLRPSVLAWALAYNPHHSAGVWPRYWRRAAGSGLLSRRGARREAGAPGPAPGTPGVYSSDANTQWTYKVAPGDTPSGLAHSVTGNGGLSGPGNYTELMDANPGKATVGTRGTWSFNFASFVAGETINIPKTWNPWITEAGQWGGTNGVPYPPNPAPAAPSTPTPAPSGEYTSTLPAGRITALKLELGAWGKKTGSMTTYPGAFDVNDVIDESFRGAVAQFQGWSNANGGPGLRTDGALDKATADAIDAYATSAAGTGTGYTPAAVPTTIPWLPTPATTIVPPITTPIGIPGTGTTPPLPNPFAGAPSAAPTTAAGSSSSSSGGGGIAVLLAVGVLATQFLK